LLRVKAIIAPKIRDSHPGMALLAAPTRRCADHANDPVSGTVVELYLSL
jgi:hypothetical protein